VTQTGRSGGANQPREEAVRRVRITPDNDFMLRAVLDRVRPSFRLG
jgi:hypothetical protein